MSKKRFRVAHLGLGQRGTVHADAFLGLADDFELVGICETRQDRLADYGAAHGISPSLAFTDAEEMLARTRPEIFCFVTPPSVSRLGFAELAAKYGVQAIALEKPMAISMTEAEGIVRVCRSAGIKAVVSHQQKYLTSFQRMKSVVDEGRIGQIQLMTASCQAWLAQLGTHFVDYLLWLNRGIRAEWVVGHVHGRELLADHHPSPNFVMGQIGFANGVRALVEFGRLSASHLEPGKFWLDNRLTAWGSHGHVWAETDGRWGGLVEGKAFAEQLEFWPPQEATVLQPLYLKELAQWLRGEIAEHSCGLDQAFAGYQIMEALCLSALDHRRVDLPLPLGGHPDVYERMRHLLPDCPERR